jgi:hypothetical protein
MARLFASSSVVIALAWSPVALCDVVVIDSNTTIDEANSLPDSVISVRDGMDGPSALTIVNGGRVGTSTIEASEIRGSSSVQLLAGGEFGPVNVGDSSEYHHGGKIFPHIDPLAPPPLGIVVADSSAKVLMSDGELWTLVHDTPGVLAKGSSQVEVSGGMLVHLGASPGVVAEGTSQISVKGGEIAGGSSSPGYGVHLTESSHANISGGLVDAHDADGLFASDMATVEVTGGRLSSQDAAGLRLSDAASAIVSAGTVFGEIGMLLSEMSHAEILGGTIGGVKLNDSASVNISGGDVWGDGYAVDVTGTAQANLNGGVFAAENVVIRISNAGVLNLNGGSLSLDDDDGTELVISDFGVANVFGFDLQIADVEVTGFLADGSPVAWKYQTSDAAQLILHELPPPVMPGDYNRDGAVDATDIDIMSYGVTRGSTYEPFDLDQSGTVETADRTRMVTTLIGTWFGDANLDGLFDSADLVEALAAGEYEDDVPMNSGWATGDWNGDSEFTSEDLVVALADGGYKQGPRLLAMAVSEPTSIMMLMAGWILTAIVRKSRWKHI